MEWFRSKMQESEQARGAGIRLGGVPEGSAWNPTDADWLSAARMGRRRRAAAGAALADVTVWPHPASIVVQHLLLLVMLAGSLTAQYSTPESQASYHRYIFLYGTMLNVLGGMGLYVVEGEFRR